MQSDIEAESVKQIEKVFFAEGMYYSVDPSRKNYKSDYPLYKCIYSSKFGALLQAFRETGEIIGERFVPHGAKRYILSDLNEESMRIQHYNNFISIMSKEAEEHQKLADKLKMEVVTAQSTLESWKTT